MEYFKSAMKYGSVFMVAAQANPQGAALLLLLVVLAMWADSK